MAEGGACLIVGPAWVGDMVMAQCLAKALKDDKPDRAIDIIAPAWTLPVIRRMPEVRAGIEVPFEHGRLSLRDRWRHGRKLRGQYDQAFVLPNTMKSALTPWFAGIARRTGYLGEQRYGLLNDIHPLPAGLKRRTAAKFQALAGEGPLTRPALAVDIENQRRLCERWLLETGKFVAFAPGAEFGPSKRWPAPYYAELARHFEAEGLRVAIFGSPRDAPVGEEVAAGTEGALNLCGKTGLDDAVDLIAAARLAVTNDSGLMHIASAVSVPTVAIFGSSGVADTPPLSPLAVTVSAGLSCSPCFARTCPLGHTDCMNTLGVERVVEACREALGQLDLDNGAV